MSELPSRPFIEADVDLLSADQGGRRGPIKSGYRPVCHLADLSDGRRLDGGASVFLLDAEWLMPGARGRARIVPFFPEYWPDLAEGSTFELCEGTRVVGTARVTRRLPLPRLIVDLDPPSDTPVAFSGGTAPLVYFLSFAFAARYGAQHELSIVTRLLREKHKIDLKPLLTFADHAAQDEADRQELERLWQEAAPLAECCRRVVDAIEADAAIREQLGDFPALRDRVEELGRIASWAAADGRRVRLTYRMD